MVANESIHTSLLTVREQLECVDFVEAAPDSDIYHLPGWSRVFERVYGIELQYWAAKQGNTVQGVLPLFELKSIFLKHALISPPGGVLALNSKAASALLNESAEEAERINVDYVLIKESRTDQSVHPFQIRRGSFNPRLDLPESSEELWSLVGPKVRNLIRKSRSFDLTADIIPDGVDEFYHVYAQNMKELGTPVYSKKLFTAMLDEFGDRIFFVLVRESGGKVVGAMLCFGLGDRLIGPFASSLRAYFRYSPNMLLYWTALEHARSCGFRHFEFGSSLEDSGSMRFKLQWGANPVPNFDHFQLLKRNALPDIRSGGSGQSRMSRLWRHMPLPITLWLGPLIRKQIPFS